VLDSPIVNPPDPVGAPPVDPLVEVDVLVTSPLEGSPVTPELEPESVPAGGVPHATRRTAVETLARRRR